MSNFAQQPHVLLWSGTSNALHIETVDSMLSNNREAYRDERLSDWIVIGAGTHDECSDLADAVRGTLRARQEARDAAAHAIGRARKVAAP
jgi:hypothetical protein